jgi:glycosyltransferase involved in cell wall biosynthesis
MRLLVCGPGYPFRGGIARTTTELVQALTERGHEVVYLTPTRQYPEWLFPGGNDRDPAACPRLEAADPCLDPLNPLTWPEMRERARAAQAAAWVIPYWTWAWTGCWRYLLQGERPPVVAVVHNPVDHDAGPLRKLAARLVLSRCDGLLTHARTLADGLCQEYPQLPVADHPLPSVTVSRFPERNEARAALDLPDDARIALFFGIIRPYKGVDLLIDAWAGLPEGSEWRLLIVGEPWGDLGAKLRRQVEELGLSDQVSWDLRWVGEDEMVTCLAAADLLVLPYRSGSQSAVAAMALAHGLPVVSSNVGGLGELVRHGDNGLLVPPGSVTSLTAALAGLDDQQLHRLAAGARAGAGRYTWSGYVATLEELLTELGVDTL